MFHFKSSDHLAVKRSLHFVLLGLLLSMMCTASIQAKEKTEEAPLPPKKVAFDKRWNETYDACVDFAIENLGSVPRAIRHRAKNTPGRLDEKAALAEWKTLSTIIKELTLQREEDIEAAKEKRKKKEEVTEWRDVIWKDDAKVETLFTTIDAYIALQRKVVFANPSLDFDQLLFRRSRDGGFVGTDHSSTDRSKIDYSKQKDHAQEKAAGMTYNAINVLDMKNPEGPTKTIISEPNSHFVGDVCLHWDAERMLVTTLAKNKTWQVFEVPLKENAKLRRQVSVNMGADVDNCNGIYLPDGGHIFISDASMNGVPCINGRGEVGVLYRVDADGKTVRQLTFDQDQNWFPTVMEDGRIMYLRWEYNGTPHCFSRILFTMNPDGTTQMARYGSGSYWPNGMYYAKPIPNHPNKFVAIVEGHHDIPQQGAIYLFDLNKGIKEADGVVQQLPGYGREPYTPIGDGIFGNNRRPRCAYPYPLDEHTFLAAMLMTKYSPLYNLYVIDTFDNIVLLRHDPMFEHNLLEPIPVIKRETPPVIASRVDLTSKDANVFITDIYEGPGLADVPRGTVKKLRLLTFSYYYRCADDGTFVFSGQEAVGYESTWEPVHIVGEVPVYEDGSASFTIPANTPISMQPLDEQGRALQIMRSWLVGTPGENVSCVGCHEDQRTVTPSKQTIAAMRAPAKIQPHLGPRRAFSYQSEIRPILKKYCIGCHDGKEKGRPNFADWEKTGPYDERSGDPIHFPKDYLALSNYIRRPGIESEMEMFYPMEYHATTTQLAQMLEKGHHGVKLDDESMRRLFLWGELNTPCFSTWTESLDVLTSDRKKKDPKLQDVHKRYEHVMRRQVELRKLYANVDVYDEDQAYRHEKIDFDAIKFIPPQRKKELDYSAPKVANWPFSKEEAVAKQKALGDYKRRVNIAEKVSFDMAKIPAGSFVMGDKNGFEDELPRCTATIKTPFWMMTTEVTNGLYRQFDPEHHSRYIDKWWLNFHNEQGYPANRDHQPVIRVTWERANDFCKWLSKKTGNTYRLPTEAQWEWACRAGAATPMWYGDRMVDYGKLENLADEEIHKFVLRGIHSRHYPNHKEISVIIPHDKDVNDGQQIPWGIAQHKPNPWELFDMHGNVSEWTRSDYKAYPYNANDGRNAGNLESKKVARGGSWRMRAKWSGAGVRTPYESHQKVYNVGFRLICEE